MIELNTEYVKLIRKRTQADVRALEDFGDDTIRK